VIGGGQEWYNSCYTTGMKTAVSLPDDLFRKAEVAAKKLRVSRSQLYATAIAEFLERSRSERVTEKLNELYSGTRAEIHPALGRAQMKSLPKGAW
jgi:metal-responsive CopG/Arc/MetJ family transcriptional regulator